MPQKRVSEDEIEVTEDDRPMIVYREHKMENVDGVAVQTVYEHRVALSEWPAYATEHGF